MESTPIGRRWTVVPGSASAVEMKGRTRQWIFKALLSDSSSVLAMRNRASAPRYLPIIIRRPAANCCDDSLSVFTSSGASYGRGSRMLTYEVISREQRSNMPEHSCARMEICSRLLNSDSRASRRRPRITAAARNALCDLEFSAARSSLATLSLAFFAAAVNCRISSCADAAAAEAAAAFSLATAAFSCSSPICFSSSLLTFSTSSSFAAI
mmetsp:Transcript_34255/g.90493  ORF Transcript_34255/g.90493 Transcript_34255/m.90493 type:complete len:211 (-) Transcript_34255:317-949(-)